ncbi:carbamoyl-phosphate synthase (glutamine-hydrolyzing) large subunit [Saccharolobus shibatae]|uniref:Carbamoyl phosphate synthase large chain n=2 Tax=Saccharolobus shibatae TaxID=2286 RepID=A0A8F5C3G3_9CREN|nr:carbamoyl-phosphate synthase (glutamine-hydrolyzing) large subunit [Saccharolobus shibatae]QXJ29877.1 Carbamoyl-phosphate synthase large chain [Saccharolobus shibatae B12]QXJ33113.1 Carbamoyl-phosphate synthase large chain [Saccharolobus shibatae]QXJ36230.1 Carbamoyl-phosphate synthase large chain [Saccharolobus shibatae]
MKETPKKVLVVGSGPIKIAEAAEFDYSGSQALKALKEEGIETVLVNSNVATVQTSKKFADKLYMLPVVWWAVEKVIEKERPDGIMIGFGGQTALNVGVDLHKKGVLQKYSVKVLGTQIDGIEKALSREKFRETMIENNLPVPPSLSARSEEEAIKNAKIVGYPVMVRVSFNLGGRGSMVAWTEEDLKKNIRRALSQSYIGEVLIEKYLYHWIELEYEVMRDKKGNSAVIACIENLDPMGVHTGESTVVAPCQTLDNLEYQNMRTYTIEVARSINLIGECNVQFALNPKGYEYYIIETNPRMSRSSALASKATGYPLAYVSAKLALGYELHDVINKVSGRTCACFEPSLDYIVTKIPRWDLSKFENVDQSLGTEMMSVGEVMSIGRSFEESLQKAVRMLDIGEPGVVGGKIYEAKMSKMEALKYLKERRPYWFLYVAKAFKEGATIDEVYEVTGISKFFLNKIKGLVDFYETLKISKEIDEETLKLAKKLGFSDEQISKALNKSTEYVRKIRDQSNIIPVVKLIDTLAGEWPSVTNYMYLTYNGIEDDIEFSQGNKLLIVGAGGFRIGVSVEFDWSVVSLMEAASKYFDEVAILNYNPETVSTDWDIARKLYFDEINVERVLDLIKKEKFRYVATFSGGQIGNSIAKELEENGVRLLGTSGSSVDIAENREKFSKLLDKLGISQPNWISATSLEEIKKFLNEVGFPVLVRPSYVLSGSSMKIAYSEEELYEYVRRATEISPKYPVVISKYIENAIEAEVDGVSDGNRVLGITLEHVEEAGVHSGDATMSIPFRKLSENSVNKMRENVLSLARELNIKGPFNVQFVVKDNTPHIIELNLRASRSMPFSSKAKGINLMNEAMKAIFNGLDFSEDYYEPPSKYWAVKSPQFSWSQLRGAYPFLGPEMKSTGEAASFGVTFYDALLKSWLSSMPNRIPNKNGIALVYGDKNLDYLKDTAVNLVKFGLTVYSISELPLRGIETIDKTKAEELVRAKKVEIVVTDGYLKKFDYNIRRTAVDYNIPVILNGRLGYEVSKAFLDYDSLTFFEISEYGGGI